MSAKPNNATTPAKASRPATPMAAASAATGLNPNRVDGRHSQRAGMILVALFGLAFIGGGAAWVFWPSKTPAVARPADTGTPAMETHELPSATRDRREGLYVRKNSVDVYSGHGVMIVALPTKSASSYTFAARAIDDKGLTRVQRELLSNNATVSGALTAAGVSTETLARIRELPGMPPSFGKEEDARLRGLFDAWSNAVSNARVAARTALLEALAAAGEKYVSEAQLRFGARRALLTDEQWAAFSAARESAIEADRVARAATRPATRASMRPSGGRGPALPPRDDDPTRGLP